MNRNKNLLTTLLLSAYASSPLLAHNESQHPVSDEKPNCGAIQNMDHSKMSKNDPVMMAMMKKCMKANAKGHTDETAHGSMTVMEHGEADTDRDLPAPAEEHKDHD